MVNAEDKDEVVQAGEAEDAVRRFVVNDAVRLLSAVFTNRQFLWNIRTASASTANFVFSFFISDHSFRRCLSFVMRTSMGLSLVLV